MLYDKSYIIPKLTYSNDKKASFVLEILCLSLLKYEKKNFITVGKLKKITISYFNDKLWKMKDVRALINVTSVLGKLKNFVIIETQELIF